MDEIPQSVEGMPVMAAMRIPPGLGELPTLFVAIVDDGEDSPTPSHRYIVWNVAKRHGLWVASEGSYDMRWDEAVEEYIRRIGRDAVRHEWGH